MPTITIVVREERVVSRECFSLIAEGNEIRFTAGGIPPAPLAPIGIRVAGLHAGAIRTSEDFDDPLPEELGWAYHDPPSGHACFPVLGGEPAKKNVNDLTLRPTRIA
ncbi:MAG: hypothetical protein V2B18_18875 [Pseudomonadota bacterium]